MNSLALEEKCLQLRRRVPRCVAGQCVGAVDPADYRRPSSIVMPASRSSCMNLACRYEIRWRQRLRCALLGQRAHPLCFPWQLKWAARGCGKERMTPAPFGGSQGLTPDGGKGLRAGHTHPALGHSTRWRRGGSCDAGRRSPCGRSWHWHAKSPSETPHFRPL